MSDYQDINDNDSSDYDDDIDYDNIDVEAETAAEQREFLGYDYDSEEEVAIDMEPIAQQPADNIMPPQQNPNRSFSSNNKIRHGKRFADIFKVSHYLTIPTKFTGKNTLFRKGRSSFFLLEFPFKHKQPKHSLITNNPKFKDFIFNSDRKNAFTYYTIKQYISGVF